MKTFIGWKQKQLKIYNSAVERETFFINNISNSSGRWKLKLLESETQRLKEKFFILNCLPVVGRKKFFIILNPALESTKMLKNTESKTKFIKSLNQWFKTFFMTYRFLVVESKKSFNIFIQVIKSYKSFKTLGETICRKILKF